MKNLKLLLFFTFVFLPVQSFSFQDELYTLNEFENIETYELHLINTEQSCLNERGGDISATGCFIKSSAWKASADYYQAQLEKRMQNIDKKAFLEAVNKLMQYENAMTKMNEIALEFKYNNNGHGTMFKLMRESDKQELISTINKFKALYFKKVLDIYADNHYSQAKDSSMDKLNLITSKEKVKPL